MLVLIPYLMQESALETTIRDSLPAIDSNAVADHGFASQALILPLANFADSKAHRAEVRSYQTMQAQYGSVAPHDAALLRLFANADSPGYPTLRSILSKQFRDNTFRLLFNIAESIRKKHPRPFASFQELQTALGELRIIDDDAKEILNKFRLALTNELHPVSGPRTDKQNRVPPPQQKKLPPNIPFAVKSMDVAIRDWLKDRAVIQQSPASDVWAPRHLEAGSEPQRVALDTRREPSGRLLHVEVVISRKKRSALLYGIARSLLIETLITHWLETESDPGTRVQRVAVKTLSDHTSWLTSLATKRIGLVLEETQSVIGDFRTLQGTINWDSLIGAAKKLRTAA